MIYLIGGPPRSGKTILTKQLTKKLNVPWISADTVESIVENTFLQYAGSIDSEQYAKLFPKNVLRIQTEDSNDTLFNNYTAEQVGQAFIEQAKSVSEAIKTMVAAEASVGHDYIIEGHQLQPRLADELIKKSYEVKTIFLIRKDIQQISDGLQKNQAKRDWVLQKTRQQGSYPKIAAMIAYYSGYIEKEARRLDLPVFTMDGDFFAQIEAAVQFLS